MRQRVFCVQIGLILVLSTLTEARAQSFHNWPQWRGPLGTGVAPHANPPVEWSESKNIRWKLALPGVGHSTPIVWGDRVFVTTAVPYGEALKPKYSGLPHAHDELPITHRHKFMVMAVSRRDGKLLWERTVREDLPHAGGHYTASLASQSPVTDGERLFAFFGSYGLYCLSLDGQLLWEKDLGQMYPLHGHGEGSSPVLYRDTLIINWDHEGPSFVVAFEVRTGKERWKVKRDAASSWTTPIIVEDSGVPQVIISGSKRVRGYDLATGRVIWECGGLSVENVVSSPVAGDGMVYAGSSYDKQAMLAIRFDGATGDITGTKQVVWSRTRGAPYVPSPLLYGDSLYFLRQFGGILTRVNARTGEDRPGALRLNGIGYVFASPVGAAGRVYITDRDGATLVISHDDSPKFLALNRLDDSFSASPAVVGNELFLRGEEYLYCIAEANEHKSK
ncbi:PQQ-like beta-propeller repeat protein [Candidatus Poribacteria bacterium]|nr:PQQ-like beta-propeller repeat protein [Candidatus Poribacteria bacterium]